MVLHNLENTNENKIRTLLRYQYLHNLLNRTKFFF